jgi:Protein of unknown function (DUF2384)
VTRSTFRNFAVPGQWFGSVPDLSKVEVRERMSQAAVDGFFRIVERWGLKGDEPSQLLGLTRSTLHRLKTGAGIRTQDELTRISYLVAIYKDLHLLLPKELADAWMTRENDNPLFGGARPLDYALRFGIPGLEQIRGLLDAVRGGL